MPLPAVHCQPCWLEARSPSTSSRMKCRAPHHHGRCRSLTRKLATIMRTRLCIQACSRSWRIPASTIGKPVRPAHQASNARSAAGPVGHRQRVEGPVVVAAGPSPGAGAGRRRRTRARPARCGRCRPTPSGGTARSASMVRGWIAPYLRYTDIREVPGRSGRSPVLAVVGHRRRRGTPPTARARPPRRPRAARPRPPRRPGSGTARGPPSFAARIQPGHGATRRCRPASRQPCSAQARRNGVNTRNGSPSALRTRPGATAYGEPVRTSSRPSAASALGHRLVAAGAVRARSRRPRAPSRRRPRPRSGAPRRPGHPARPAASRPALASRSRSER